MSRLNPRPTKPWIFRLRWSARDKGPRAAHKQRERALGYKCSDSLRTECEQLDTSGFQV
jgi:hypothetical protein